VIAKFDEHRTLVVDNRQRVKKPKLKNSFRSFRDSHKFQKKRRRRRRKVYFKPN